VSNISIKAEGLSKRYRIGTIAGYKTIRETLEGVFMAPFRRGRTSDSSTVKKYIWALKDVSFEVERGQVMGVIGRNGSGKSTFLKVLSRIVNPTEGRVEIHGHVGSLLEVGTGFHPELTGRENIQLNAAILGMKKADVKRNMEGIIDFAGEAVKNFIDTPIKHYSSGMFVRLAFAVAAHFNPEVLIVDEVLAVGDAAFQEKCLGTMDGLAKSGHTVVFVSHNMDAVRKLCTQAIMLESGKIVDIGKVEDVAAKYVKSISGAGS
jgi:lipopolysaccharide transport system ATP-binding protein